MKIVTIEARRWAGGLAVVFVLALAVRLLFLHESSSSPAWGVLFIDSAQYDQWARQIAGGNWLGTGVFFQAPLYPYFLGVVYGILGTKLLGVLLVQVLLGSISCVLLAIAGRRWFDARTGLRAGLILAVCPAAVFSDTLIQKSVLDVFLVCLLLATLGAAFRQPTPVRWLTAGLAMGALMLTRENAIVFIFVLAPCVYLCTKGLATGRRAAIGLAGVLGMAILLGPVALRNWHTGGEFFLTTSQSGFNLFIGNNPRSQGTYAAPRPDEQVRDMQDARELAESALGRHLSAGEISRYWRDEALRFMTDHPFAWIGLMARKTLLLLNDLELPDSYDQYTYGDWSSLLRILTAVVRFGVLLPLAGAGIVVTWPRRRELWPLLAMTALYAGSVVLFFVFSRYRLPLVPLLILYAAAFLGSAVDALRPGKDRLPWAALTVALALSIISNWPIRESSEKKVFKATMLNNIVVTIIYQPGRSAEAERIVKEAIRLNPGFAPSYYYLGLACKNQGRYTESLDALRKSASMLPDVPESHFQIGEVLVTAGRPGDAIPWYRRALEIDPEEPLWLVALAKALHAVRNDPAARATLERAAALGGASPAVRSAIAEARASIDGAR